jgi:large subunit ribosomal protein L21
VPKQDGSPTAIVAVGGGKQYRVAVGDRILVDRLDAAAGEELKLDKVLLLVDGDEFTVGTPLIKDQVVTARVINHPRGPKIDMLRYKSKKHVRVHRGARADLTAIEILTVGGKGKEEKKSKAEKEATDGA